MAKIRKRIPAYFNNCIRENHYPEALYPFSFMVTDEGDEYFSIAGKKITPAKFHSKTFVKNIPEGAKGIDYARIMDYPLVTTPRGALIAGPPLHEFLNSPGRIKNTAKLLGELGIGITTEAGTDVMLSLESSDAILAPVEDGLYINRVREIGFAEYRISGDTSKQDRVSLYAGIGYVAHLAELRQAGK